jgi:AmmeMemoRadiSam system protein B
MIRAPAVAGQFYSASAEQLHADVSACMPGSANLARAVAAVAPHAGLIYSGQVTGAVYDHLAIPSTIVLIGPNHTGLGPAVSVFPDGRWDIPGGEIPIDREFTGELLSAFPSAQPDTSAHLREHCLEVQLPFLLHAAARRPAARRVAFVAIVLGTTDWALCDELGAAVAQLVHTRTEQGRDRPLLIASTDMNHYEPEDTTRRKDALAIEALERLDARALYDRAQQHRISMCGLGPAIVTITAARILAAQQGRLIRYATSGGVSGDYSRVVGYAGLVIS